MLLTEDWVKSLNLDDSLAREALSHGVSTCLQWQLASRQWPEVSDFVWVVRVAKMCDTNHIPLATA